MNLFHRFALSTPVSSQYVPALQKALFVYSIFFILTALVMDFGHTNWCAITAIFAHLLAITMIIVRRPDAPTKSDLLFFRYGYIFLFAVSVFMAPHINEWLGGKMLLDRWFGLRLMP